MWKILLWQNIQWTSLGEALHPMIRVSKNQRLVYESITEMYDRYRTKNIFKKISDDNLKLLIKGLTNQTKEGAIEIKYPKNWELQIYRAGLISDKQIWKHLNKLNKDILILFAEFTRVPDINIVSKLSRKSHFIAFEFIKGYSHLFPFENPELVADKIICYLNNN